MSPAQRLMLAVCAVVVAAAALPSAAGATLLPTAPDCPDEVQVTRFVAWGDHARYVGVGDARFEQGAAGWIRRRSTVVEDNAPLAISPDDHRALEVSGSATSPPFCIGIEHPTIRFFARNEGSALSALLVQVVVTTSLGLKVAVPIGVVAGGLHRWRPTPRMMLIANLLMLAPGRKTQVRFRFTALGLGARWRLDDIFVDPYSKR